MTPFGRLFTESPSNGPWSKIRNTEARPLWTKITHTLEYISVHIDDVINKSRTRSGSPAAVVNIISRAGKGRRVAWVTDLLLVDSFSHDADDADDAHVPRPPASKVSLIFAGILFEFIWLVPYFLLIISLVDMIAKMRLVINYGRIYLIGCLWPVNKWRSIWMLIRDWPPRNLSIRGFRHSVDTLWLGASCIYYILIRGRQLGAFLKKK